MQCGHCGTDYHPNTGSHYIGNDANFQVWLIQFEKCPRCQKLNIRLTAGTQHPQAPQQILSVQLTRTVYPKQGTSRASAPLVVPKQLQEDYNEACLVLGDSPKASAALSRRCLQSILRDYAKVKHQKLFSEIEEAINSKQLPSHICEDLHAIREIGNFAAHPTKDTSTGEIVPVEPGEAEWLLDLLEGLFDFYFVAPAETQKRRDALNSKLKAAGKNPI
jgi:Domain of unknown function (DUF4145)